MRLYLTPVDHKSQQNIFQLKQYIYSYWFQDRSSFILKCLFFFLKKNWTSVQSEEINTLMQYMLSQSQFNHGWFYGVIAVRDEGRKMQLPKAIDYTTQ